MGKRPNERPIQSVVPAGKRTTQRKGAGEALEPIWDPSVTKQTNPKKTTPQVMMIHGATAKHPRPLQVRPNPKGLTQKTNIATTPTSWDGKGPTICHIGPGNHHFLAIWNTTYGLPIYCLAATDGKSMHHNLQQYPSLPKTNAHLGYRLHYRLQDNI